LSIINYTDLIGKKHVNFLKCVKKLGIGSDPKKVRKLALKKEALTPKCII